MKTLYHSLFYVGTFCMIIFFGIQCQKETTKETDPIDINETPESNLDIDYTSLDKNGNKSTILTSRALGDTLYTPIRYGGELKVYPNTIVRCRNKKTGLFEYQAVFSGDQLLPGCKYQQINYYDKVNIADTALIRPNDTFYLCRRVIK